MLFRQCRFCPFNRYHFLNEHFMLDFTQHMSHCYNRAPQGEVNRILGLLVSRQPNIFTELNSYGINRRAVTYLFRLIIGYSVDNEDKYSGNLNEKTVSISKDFQKTYSSVLQAFLASRIPPSKLEDILTIAIRFTLANLRRRPIPRYIYTDIL